MKTLSALNLCLSSMTLLFSSTAFCADTELQNTVSTTEETKNSAIFLTLQEHDHTFFERAFNQCDAEYLEKSIAKDFRMYHDKGGPQERSQFLTNFKKNMCSNPDKKNIRKLEEGSLQVFPLYNEGNLYGAIQSGIHHFYTKEPNKKEIHNGTASFTHIYLLEGEQWILKEALSYDHTAARKIEPKPKQAH